MRMIIALCLLVCSCTKRYIPPPQAVPEGIYQGYDSALYVHDKYASKMFGACIDVKRINGSYVFFDRILTPVDGKIYTFDYVTVTDYGMGAESDIHHIRRKGTFTFSYNHLIVAYSVGDSGKTMSQYKFNGWR